MLKQGPSNNHIVLFAEVTQLLPVVIDHSKTMSSHHPLSAYVVVSDSGIQMDFYFLCCCLQLFIKSVLSSPSASSFGA